MPSSATSAEPEYAPLLSQTVSGFRQTPRLRQMIRSSDNTWYQYFSPWTAPQGHH